MTVGDLIPAVERELYFRELARRRMEYFLRYTFGDNYLMGWVHQAICTELDRFLADVMSGRSPRLALFMPPRHGKSEIVSRRFPAFCFGKYPDLSIISTSYGADLSGRMNRDVQRIIDSSFYRTLFPETNLYGKNIRSVSQGTALRNSDIFEIVGHKGSYRSAGVGGGITGMGSDILIIDDPVKDRKEADSPTVRDSVYEWYTSTAYTRLSPGGGVLLIMTRWHEDDLAGRILEDMKNDSNPHKLQWRIISFPAIAETDEIHRRQGDALHPERFNIEHLLSIKASLPDRDWSSLYQQNPKAGSGAVFKQEWFRYWTPEMLPKKWDDKCHSWDMTFKDTDGSDFVVGQDWRRKGADLYLIDQVRGRMDFVKTCEEVINFSARHPEVWTKLVEEKANGAAVMNALKSKISGLIPVIPAESKLARAYAVTPPFRSGNVYIPLMSTWAKDYEHELTIFPAGTYDDQVDATSQGITHLLQSPTTDYGALL
jgi:predicted phage terminase large subunit-like protein